MSDADKYQKRILRDMPDITAARQEETMRQYRDTIAFHNTQMAKLGLCDGMRCKHHQVVSGTGTGRDMCRCKRVSKSRTPQERKYWQEMHFENCSAGRAMEKNLGCKGFEMEGAPLYQQRVAGRKII